MVDQYTYHYRRPGFLLALSDTEYVTVFENLRAKRDQICPTWLVVSI
jgi:hypothetical protein